jgi:hypothetical protein
VRRVGDTVRLFTRRGYDWSGRYPAIAVTATLLRARSFTLDGEAVVCGSDGVAIFDALHRSGPGQIPGQGSRVVSRMPTPVEVSCVERRGPGQIEALGGIWRGQPWSMSERSLIAEIELPDDRRAWNFFVTIDGHAAPIVLFVDNGRKHLSVAGDPAALLRLPEMPRERALGWEV